MIVVHHRLFWKIYLTLLTSLVAVAVLMGALWWLLGESPQERRGVFRLHLTETLAAARDAAPSVAAEAVQRLGDKIDADISVYGGDGQLVAARGTPIALDPPDEPSRPGPPRHVLRIDLPDGRTVLARVEPSPGQRILHILTAVLTVVGGVGLAAYPMTARLTRQLEKLRRGMARWGAGELSARADESGNDEVALVARTFNVAAQRINMLLTSQRALLANASHELRSPLTRLRLAVDLWLQHPDKPGRDEIVRNLAELDHLVEEILLSSRLDHPNATIGALERVDLLGLAAEEAARAGVSLEGDSVDIDGNETLLRRLLRNLIENGLKHGKPPVRVTVARVGQAARIIVSDEGDGIPTGERERVFEPFYRPAGRGEASGGWGLGLSLVRQIARRHGGQVFCESGEGAGTRFIVDFVGDLPAETLSDTTTAPPQPGRAVPYPVLQG